MKNQKGIIVKIKDAYCIVVTPEGLYRKIPVPSNPVTVGSEVLLGNIQWNKYLKPAVLAASLIALALFLSIFNWTIVPQPVAYLSLDINPSIEIAVGKDLSIMGVTGYNSEGNLLLNRLSLKNKTVGEAYQMIIKEAINQKYLNPNQEGIVMATLAQHEQKSEFKSALTRAFIQTTNRENISAEFRFYEVDTALYQEANSNGLTVGKYLIYQQILEKDGNISLETVKITSIRQLLDQFELTLLPDDKRILFKINGDVPDDAVQLRLLLKERNRHQLQQGDQEDVSGIPPEGRNTISNPDRIPGTDQGSTPNHDHERTQNQKNSESNRTTENNNNNPDSDTGTGGSDGAGGTGGTGGTGTGSGSDSGNSGSTDSGPGGSGSGNDSGSGSGSDSDTGSSGSDSGSGNGSSGSGSGGDNGGYRGDSSTNTNSGAEAGSNSGSSGAGSNGSGGSNSGSSDSGGNGSGHQ